MGGSASYAAALLRRLRNSSVEAAQSKAAEALGQLASKGALQRDAVVAAGGIPALVRCLDSSSRALQYAAAVALSDLVRDSHSNSLQLVQAGAVPAMLRLLSSGDAKVQMALGVLANTAGRTPEFAAGFVDQGGIEVLLHAINSASDEHVQCTAFAGVAKLCLHSQAAEQAALRGGAASAAVRALSSGRDTEMLLGATACAGALPDAGRDVLLAAGAPAALLRALHVSGGDVRMQAQVAVVLCNLSCNSLPAKAAITAAGGVQAMVRLLSSSDTEVLRAAAGVLRNLADDARDPTQQVWLAGSTSVEVHRVKTSCWTAGVTAACVVASCGG
ncbi:hypothetical protein ABPG75_000167 [Micractinium tetrahymenae]